MITRLEENSQTQHAWNGRDNNRQHHFGAIPIEEQSTSLSLTWRKSGEAKRSLVGHFVLKIAELAKKGYVRKIEGSYIPRFQRTDRVIEIAQNRTFPVLLLGPLSKGY